MDDPRPTLSDQSLAVLEMIAAGSTYEQILAAYPDLTYLDIFRAAEDALDLAYARPRRVRPTYTLTQKQERYPRAYEEGTAHEDDRLRTLVRSGETVARIAGTLQRNRGGIRSRIVKLDLVADLMPYEQKRLKRIRARDGLASE
jgi:hypothetical protein